MNLARIVLLGLAVLTVAGCAGPLKTEKLTDSVRTYNEGVRWQRFTHAANHIPDPERGAFLTERNELEAELRISEWEILQVDYQREDRRLAEVHVRYTWFLDREGLVQETTSVQTWELRGKRWFLAEEVRSAGPEMPGLPEPHATCCPAAPELSAR